MTSLGRAYNSLLRLGFHLLYNDLAWSYDLVSWAVSLGQWRAWGRASLPFLLGPRVLEVAFGTGDILVDLQTAGFTVYGLDLSPYMTAITHRKLQKAGVTAPISCGAVQSLPFTDGVFDSVLITFTPGVIREEIALQELARVLRSGGRLVVVDRAVLQRPIFLARFIESLYAITGQRPKRYTSQTDWLREIGWDATEHEQQLANSAVSLWVAERPEP
jgi:ubiquinone/menaquinone biosynthesis C-methylase UbiE